MNDRPLMSGARGAYIYVALGVAATFLVYAIGGEGPASVVGLVFWVSTMFVFPWMAGRL